MKFRLKIGPFELDVQMPEPVQVSPAELVTALWHAIAQNPMQPFVLVSEDEVED